MSCKPASGGRPWRRLLLWLPALGWYAVIFLFSAQTGAESGEISDRLALDLLRLGTDNPWTLSEVQYALLQLVTFLLRKAAHMAAYFVLTALLLLALRGLLSSKRRQAACAVGLCAVLAGLDEVHQFFVPGRSCQLRDVVIDTLGGLCFLLLWAVVRTVKRRLRAKEEAAVS